MGRGAAMQQITEWLAGLGLGQYAQVFNENGIDFSVLPDLTDQDLEKLGVLLGHQPQAVPFDCGAQRGRKRRPRGRRCKYRGRSTTSS
jgi:SAM domain (Sterile alpha motif)